MATMRTPDQIFGLLVKEHREVEGQSMTELASRLSDAGLTNFHATTVSRLERGERPVRLSEAVVIARVLGVTVDDLYQEDVRGDEGLQLFCEDLRILEGQVASRLSDLMRLKTSAWDLLKSTRAAMDEGQVLPEHMADVEQTCKDAEGLLARLDRGEYGQDDGEHHEET